MGNRGHRALGWAGFLALALGGVIGCGRDENSAEMGAVPPKPNLNAAANAPGGAPQGARPGADAEAMSQFNKKP